MHAVGTHPAELLVVGIGIIDDLIGLADLLQQDVFINQFLLTGDGVGCLFRVAALVAVATICRLHKALDQIRITGKQLLAGDDPITIEIQVEISITKHAQPLAIALRQGFKNRFVGALPTLRQIDSAFQKRRVDHRRIEPQQLDLIGWQLVGLEPGRHDIMQWRSSAATE